MIVPIEEIKENPNNPRYIRDENFKKLVESVEKFPQMLAIRPLVVDEDMVVLGGNMRLKACKEAGYNELEVIVAKGWTEEQKREFIVKDNVGYGEWDWDMLANSWDSEELEDWGLSIPSFDVEENEGEGTSEKPGEPKDKCPECGK